MRSSSVFIAALVAVALPSASSQAASREVKESWGKPGVSFQQYRTDAITCGAKGYFHDISDTEAAKAFVDGSRQIDSLLGNFVDARSGMDNAIQAGRVVQSVRPEKRMEEVRVVLQSTVDQCLIELGYSKFRLTEGQMQQLEKLKNGSPERHAYLHRLASDPRILAAQSH